MHISFYWRSALSFPGTIILKSHILALQYSRTTYISKYSIFSRGLGMSIFLHPYGFPYSLQTVASVIKFILIPWYGFSNLKRVECNFSSFYFCHIDISPTWNILNFPSYKFCYFPHQCSKYEMRKIHIWF